MLQYVLRKDATTLILLGDPQQLEQPSQGSHPDGTDASALDHILGGNQTILPEQGLFLEKSWRLHPDICEFNSGLKTSETTLPGLSNIKIIRNSSFASTRPNQFIKNEGTLFHAMSKYYFASGDKLVKGTLSELIIRLEDQDKISIDQKVIKKISVDDTISSREQNKHCVYKKSL